MKQETMAALGGFARAKKLSKKRLSEIGRAAANARWARVARDKAKGGKRKRTVPANSLAMPAST